MADDFDVENFLEEHGDEYQKVDTDDTAEPSEKPFDPDQFLQEHGAKDGSGFDPDKFINENKAPTEEISPLKSFGAGVARGSTLGMAPKLWSYLRSVSDPSKNYETEKSDMDKFYKESESQNPLSSTLGDVTGGIIPYGIAGAAGGPMGVAAAGTIDYAQRQPDPTKQELQTMSPMEYGLNKTVEAGSQGAVAGVFDRLMGGAGRGLKAAIPDPERMALKAAGANRTTFRKMGQSLPIDGQPVEKALAEYLMSTKGVGMRPQQILEHAEQRLEEIGPKIGAHVADAQKLVEGLPNNNGQMFMVNGSDVASAIREHIVAPAEHAMDHEAMAVGEAYAAMMEKAGPISPSRMFAIRRNLDNQFKDKAVFRMNPTNKKEAMLKVRGVFDEALNEPIHLSSIFHDVLTPEEQMAAKSGAMSPDDFSIVMETGTRRAEDALRMAKESPQSMTPHDRSIVDTMMDHSRLKSEYRKMNELEKLAEYGTEGAKGNNLIGLMSGIGGSALGAGTLASGRSIPESIAAFASPLAIQGVRNYGPMSYAKSAHALRGLPNPLSGKFGQMVGSGLRAEPGVQLSPAIVEYLKSLSQGGEEHERDSSAISTGR